jgi:hypothetical protein
MRENTRLLRVWDFEEGMVILPERELVLMTRDFIGSSATQKRLL